MNLQTAVVIDPLYISGASVFSSALAEYRRKVLLIQLAFATVVAFGLLVASGLISEQRVAAPTRVLAFGAVPLLLFTFLRAEFYLDQLRVNTIALSSLYCTVNLSLLVVLRASLTLNASTAMAALGVAATIVVSLAVAFKLRYVLGKASTTLTLAVAWREHATLAKWLLPAALLNAGAYFVPTWMTAYYLGLNATAGFRALVNLILPVTQCFTALSNILLPLLSRQWANDRDQFRRTVRHCTAFATVICAAFLCLTAAYRNTIEALIFGGKYHSIANIIPLMCALPLAQGLGGLYSLSLRAMKYPGDQTKSAALQGSVAVLGGYILIPKLGVYGTTLTYLLTYGIGAFYMAVMYYRRLPSYTEALIEA